MYLPDDSSDSNVVSGTILLLIKARTEALNSCIVGMYLNLSQALGRQPRRLVPGAAQGLARLPGARARPCCLLLLPHLQSKDRSMVSVFFSTGILERFCVCTRFVCVWDHFRVFQHHSSTDTQRIS